MALSPSPSPGGGEGDGTFYRGVEPIFCFCGAKKMATGKDFAFDILSLSYLAIYIGFMDRVTWERGYWHAYDQQKLAFARALRADMTPAEKKLWACLRAKKFYRLKFRRQEPIGPYIADFCCYAKKLIIEIDGSSHKGREQYDRDRDAYFDGCGFRVLHLQNVEVLENHGVLAFEKIRTVLAIPVPLSFEERG